MFHSVQTTLFDTGDAHNNIVSVMGVKWVIHDENLKETGMSKHKRIICEEEKKCNLCQEHKQFLLLTRWINY